MPDININVNDQQNVINASAGVYPTLLVDVDHEENTVSVTVEKQTPVVDVQVIATGPVGPQGIQGPPGADGADGADGQDGFSPVISSETITGGHRLTIVDIGGTTTVDVMDGVDGQDGADGADGADGFSPVVAVSAIAGGYEVSITDAAQTQTFNVMDGVDGQNGQDGQDGQDGTDGVSPEVTVTDISGGHRVTITDADHPLGQTFDVMDGQDASDTEVTQTATTTSGYTYWRPLLIGQNSSSTESGGFSTVTDSVRAFDNLRVQPSTGTIKATTFKGDLDGTASGNYSATNPPPGIIPAGGSTSQVLAKKTNTDYDVEWVNQSGGGGAVNSVDGKTGDVVVLPAGGAVNYVLKKNSATDYDVKWASDNNTYTSCYCSTSASTAAKVGTCSSYALSANSYLHVTMANSNTKAAALTLNVNSKGAKPIYINGAASSASNYTLPAGTYIVFYDGTNYYFRTDGKLTASITGSAAETDPVFSASAAAGITSSDISTWNGKSDFSGSYNDLTDKPSIPSPQTSGTPADLGTAARGSATTYSRSDHVHKMPSASDVGLGNVDNVRQYSASNPPPYPVTSVNGQTGAVLVHSYSYGTDGIWKYRRYYDRTYHAWFEGAVNLLAGTAFAGGYFHQTSAALTPPSFSTSVTSLSGSPNGAMLMAYVGHAQDFSTYWLNGAAAASNNYPVRLDMYGTW